MIGTLYFLPKEFSTKMILNIYRMFFQLCSGNFSWEYLCLILIWAPSIYSDKFSMISLDILKLHSCKKSVLSDLQDNNLVLHKDKKLSDEDRSTEANSFYYNLSIVFRSRNRFLFVKSWKWNKSLVRSWSRKRREVVKMIFKSWFAKHAPFSRENVKLSPQNNR